MYNKECRKLGLKVIDESRLYFTVGSSKGVALKDKNKVIGDYLRDLTTEDIENARFYLKDLGPQIAWKTVFLVEYAGPIAITLALCLFRKQIYNTDEALSFYQYLGVGLVLFHYVKRELETIFIHRFGNDTMPWMNIVKNCFGYWFVFGVCCMYFFLKPSYKPAVWVDETVSIILAGFFIFFEILNLITHVVLRNLRQVGTNQRGIPQGWGFGFVSCANYFWETLSWFTFAVFVQNWGAYLFLIMGFVQMLIWAQEKHKRYLREFPDYPKDRKAMIPFII